MLAFIPPTVLSPLLSLLIFIIGHGLLSTLLTLRLNAEEVAAGWIGLVSSAYFAGLVLGAFVNVRLIQRIGHIRAYAAYASLLAVLALCHGLWVDPLIWSGLRLVGGFATGGLFVVIESWMLVSSSSVTRGRLMAFYMILLYGGLAAGQWLLRFIDPLLLSPFALAAISASLSVLPLALTRVPLPQTGTASHIGLLTLARLTPAAVGSCVASGLVLGGVYGLLPLFFAASGRDLGAVANLMALVILGGMLLQYPLGRLSDRFDRRRILAGLGLGLLLLSIVMLIASQLPWSWLRAGTIFLFGGLAFSLYPISLSQACDELTPEQMVSANQGMLLAYSLGSMTGPLLASQAMQRTGPAALFAYFALCGGLLTLYLFWRQRQRSPVPADAQQSYTPMASNTPLGAELDPRTPDTVPAQTVGNAG